MRRERICPACGRPHLGALPGGPGNHATAHDLTVVRAVSACVGHELARVRRIPKQPGACALGCCWLRRERDSNSRYPFGVHTLSRRASSATRASLQYVSGTFRKKPDCKGSEKFGKTYKSCGENAGFSEWDYRVSCLSCSMYRLMRRSSRGMGIDCGQCVRHSPQLMQCSAWRIVGMARS